MFLLAFCFASFSFAPEKSKETRIANLKDYVVRYNGIKTPNLIFPGQAFYFPTVTTGDTYGDPHLLLDVYDKDYLLKMSEYYLYGNPMYQTTAQPLPMIMQPAPAPTPAPVVIKVSYWDSTLLWLVIFCLIVLLIVLIIKLVNAIKKIEGNNKDFDSLERKQKELLRELEDTKNKLPIITLDVVDEDWLRRNNPVGDEITSYPESAEPTFSKIYGRKPDLIVKALVSTEKNAVSMAFSHNRTAQTGLDNVVVYLGWDWDEEEDKFIEVGMIASVCSNGFEVSPEKVVPMDVLFTKFELAGDAFPIVTMYDNIPLEVDFPKLVASLVIKYHKKSISDLKRSGVKVEMPKESEKEKK